MSRWNKVISIFGNEYLNGAPYMSVVVRDATFLSTCERSTKERDIGRKQHVRCVSY